MIKAVEKGRSNVQVSQEIVITKMEQGDAFGIFCFSLRGLKETDREQ